ncbi:hypothetical protein OSB04_022748 [Centaurea solstitialis]|uniref:AIG1-type G domain-containing protein n=1 Tax=Centaurea solstitialis TaxID=347529 RepID=A0AA38SUP1_9ASTR|nr:hypothetical protein OSB04_022748 [Centaurea solstitialis]
MESKEDISNQSGFPSSVVSSDKFETVDETNASKSVANNSSNSGSISNPVGGLNPVSDDDNEGFASGEEEAFETTNSDANLVVSGGGENETETLANVVGDEGDSFLETSEFPVSSKVDDDAEKGENSSELVKDSEVRVESNGGVKVTAATEGGDSVETPAPGVVVVAKKEEEEDEDEDEEDEDDDEDEGVVLVGGPDDSKSVVKPDELGVNGGNEVEEKGEDAVVEGIDVDLPVAGVAGVAVVGKKDEDGEKMEKVLEEVVDKEVVDVTGGGFSALDVEDEDGKKVDDVEVEKGVDYEGKENGSVVENALDDVETVPTTVDSAPVTEVLDKAVPDEVTPVAESLDESVTDVSDKAVPDEAAPVAESLDKSVTDEAAPVTESLDKGVPDDDVAQKTEVLEKDLPDNGAQKTDVLDKDLPDDGAQKTEVLDKDLPDDVAQKTEVLDKDLPGVLDKDLADDGAQKTEVLDKDLANDGAQETEVLEKDLADDVAQKTEKTEVLEKDLADDVVQKTEVLDKDLADDGVQKTEVSDKDLADDGAQKTEVLDKELPDLGAVSGDVEDNGLENGPADKFVLEDSAEKDEADEGGYTDGSDEEEDTDGVIFGSSEAAKQFMEELERGSGDGGGSNAGGGESSQDRQQMMDGQIVTDSDEDDDEEDGKELFDSAALAALLKAAADGGSEGGNITRFRLFTVERPAGLGPSLQTMRAAPRPNRANIFNPASLMTASETDSNLSDEDRKKLETLQSIRVKPFPDESVAAQVLYRLALIAGRQTGQSFSLDAAKRKATELEAEGNDDLNFSVNILVIGKAGVGKSATINSIFGEEKTVISAFQPATSSVKEIRGMVGGVMIRVFDTPGLRSSVMDQGFNRQVLASAKKFTKRNPPDIVLYVDRLDAQTRDHNDIPLLKTITTALGPAIWRSAIVTFTHGASAPPEGSNGIPLSYEMFVTQRSHVVQQAIGHAVGDLRMMSPSLMNPVSLVENHQSCRKNRDGQKVLPNGQTWRPQLLMLCYSMKILAEANALSKPQDPYDNRKLFGFRVRSPPLPYMLSSMLQSRAHPKLTPEQGGGDGGDSDVDLADLSESDEEDEDEYDQLPPFKPLRKTQLSKLSREQRKAYFDEYDYRVKLLQKKQWKDEVKRMKEMKKRGGNEPPFPEEDGEGDAPAPVAVPLPDMALPPSFDGDNPAYRFRFLEPTSQFLARPVLDTHGWDHDCGYDGVNVEQSLAIASRFPAAVSVQVTKDKKDFSINMDSSVSMKHGEKGSSMAGFDVQPIGKQLAYIVRGETKFKNLKKNKTARECRSRPDRVREAVFGYRECGHGPVSDRFRYGANIEIQRRELDYPIGQVQSTVGVSIIKWRGDLALGFNGLAQFAAGRNSKVAVRAGINNKMSGQVTVKTSSSEHLSLALAAVLPSGKGYILKLGGPKINIFNFIFYLPTLTI